MMRFLSSVMAVIAAVFEWQRLIRVMRVGATVVATVTAVLLASFVAVAMGLI